MSLTVIISNWLHATSLPAQRVQWHADDGGNGHAYEVVPGQMTWFEARDEAKARGGYLATITSAAEDRFVQKLIRHDDGQPNNSMASSCQEGAPIAGSGL
jgi:hypothetical protein